MTRSHMLLGAWQIGDLQIDLPKLIETTMLVQSYSGAEIVGTQAAARTNPALIVLDEGHMFAP